MNMVIKMKHKFSEEQYKEIKKARKQNRDKQIDKRLQAVSEKHYLGNQRNMSIEEETLFLEQFHEMADFYNVSLDYLMGRTDNREVNQA